jgi:hypothetical protein
MLRQALAPLANITAVTGQKAVTDMRNGMRTLGLLIRITCTVTIGGAGITAVRNRGSLLALIDSIGVTENGVDKVLMNGRLAGFVGRCNQVVETPSAVRLSATAAAAYDLDETVFIPFGSAWQVNAADTAFVERDPRASLQAFVNWNPTAAKIATVGAGTVAFGTPTITVEQVYDDERQAKRPLFIPYYREQVMTVSASGQQAPMYLKTSRWIRALAIQQDTDEGEVSDIISAVILRGDNRDIIAPPGASVERLARAGESYSLARALNDPGYLWLPFTHGGRLSNALSPVNDSNQRFEFTAAPSATGTSSMIRVGILELERVGGLTADALNFTA